MTINNVKFNVNLIDILTEVQKECTNGMLYKIMPIKDHVMITCPYHKNGQEKHPSAQIREKDGLFWCFACHEVHSLPEVINRCLNVNGWNWLVSHYAPSEHREIELPKDEIAEFIDSSELEKYRTKHPYMYKRKLTDEIIDKFDIGYDKDFILETRDANGKIVKRSHIGECITFPVKDTAGNILFIARRAINQKFFHYPYGAKKPLYGHFEILKEIAQGKHINEIYVCESMLDALAVWSWGKYAVALNGTSSSSQYKMLQELPCRKLILALDPDDAGKTGMQKIKQNVKNKLIYTLPVPEGKDVNDLTKDEFLQLKEYFDL